MHIAIDARMYGTAQRGIGRYLMKLIENLEKVDLKSKYTIFLRRTNFDEYQPHNPNFKKALWDVPWYGWREQVFFRPLLRPPLNLPLDKGEKEGVDLYHFPHWNMPLLFRKPFIVTIHDLELFSSNRTRDSSTRGRATYWLKHLAFRAVFRHAVLASQAIIVPSNAVREQLLDMYPQVRKKVSVVYEAPTIGQASGVSDQVSELKPKTYNLKPQGYALYVGSAYPHKNLSRLLKAWQIVHQELPDYKLVLVGKEDWFYNRLKLDIRNWKLEIGDSVVFYGPATDTELAALYQNAALLVQPSLEEGFSLPPLEALSFGTPVAVSDIPVHREILGDAALYFEPRDPETIAATIKEAITKTHTRGRILHQAKAQLLRYSWRKHAEQTLQLYEQAKI